MLRDLLVAFEALLQPLDHAVLSDRDDRGGPGVHLLADRLQILVLEALVAELAPGAPGAAADDRRRDKGRREDQPDDAARDRTALRPLLATGIGGLLEPDFAVRPAHDHRGVDQLDRAFAVHRLEVLERLLGGDLVAERRDEDLNRVLSHVSSSLFVGNACRHLPRRRAAHWRAIAMCSRSSGVIRWSTSSADSARSICTQLTVPVKTLSAAV